MLEDFSLRFLRSVSKVSDANWKWILKKSRSPVLLLTEGYYTLNRLVWASGSSEDPRGFEALELDKTPLGLFMGLLPGLEDEASGGTGGTWE